jgi:hypothetical protein
MSILQLARNAWRLPSSELRLATRAAAWLALSQVALAVCRYPFVERRLSAVRARVPDGRGVSIEQCARAIDRAALAFPSSRCLARAVAGAVLLRREGHRVGLRLQVKLEAGDEFHAHATLVAGDRIVTGAGAGADWPIIREQYFPS